MHLKQKKKLIFFMSKKTKIVAIQGDGYIVIVGVRGAENRI